MTHSSLLDPDLRTRPRAASVGAPPESTTALDPVHLLPIGEGTAASHALWEPLEQSARDTPVCLFSSDSYDVWLEMHHPAAASAPSPMGTTHVVTPLREALELRRGREGTATLPSGRASVIPPGTHVAADSVSTPAIHVYSPGRPSHPDDDSTPDSRPDDNDPARFPTAIASLLTHPSQRGGHR